MTSCKSRWSNVPPMCNEETEMGMMRKGKEKEEKYGNSASVKFSHTEEEKGGE